MPRALEGIRVLDLSTSLAEITGRMLADLGAEVIKIEPPGGCEARFTPPFMDPPSAEAPRPTAGAGDPERSLFWRAYGFGKRSVVLDLDDPGDRERFLALVDTADILIESSTPGDMDARGLGYEALSARNPMLLYVSVSPFGATGPYAQQPATDLTMSAAGGMLNATGDGDRPPLPIGLPETAHLGASQAAADVLMALHARNRSGEGQHLDASIQAAVLWSLMNQTDFGALDQEMPNFAEDRAGRTGSMTIFEGLDLPVIEPCKDGFVACVLVLGAQGAFGFDACMRWIGEQGGLDADLMEIEWMTWIQQLQEGKLELATALRGIEQFKAFLRGMTKAEIQEQAVKQKWLIAPIYLAPDLLEDPQLRAREFWVDVDGDKQPGPFARLGGTPIEYDRPAPTLGQDQALVDSLDKRPSPPTVAEPSPRTEIFEGLKVADFSWIAAGPLISKDLANLGATVLRVETETRIDTLRFIPPWVGDPGTTTGHVAANMNQSKLGIAIDFTKPEGLAVAHRMVEWADVVIENFTPGTAERLGLGYEQLREIKPDIVMLYSCMRGQTGPERKHTGFGIHGAALGGFTGITGWPDRKPVSPWGAYTDFISPRFAQAALCAALHHRDRTGEGQLIDVSQIEASIHHLTPMLLDHQRTGRTLAQPGQLSERGCPHGVYRSIETERFIALETRSPDQWRALCTLVPGLAALSGGDLDDLDTRLARRDEIDAILTEWVQTQPAFETADRLREAGVPAYVPLRARDYRTDPQLVAREFFIELDHGGFGRHSFDGPVTTFSKTPSRPRRAGPLIGEHTFEVMRDVLGYSDEEISEIAATGALS
jgi:crotonobetainyl-CoA:carnitine CoA-transferase CaiB-like acyl-CoA transferase